MCNIRSPSSFLIPSSVPEEIASANSYVSSIVNFLRLSFVCFMSQGHFILSSSIISRSLLNSSRLLLLSFIFLNYFRTAGSVQKLYVQDRHVPQNQYQCQVIQTHQLHL